ncbi:MAG: succinylglutamate desuccinylase/aspartoacylase family protein [Campylobacterales bacterium]|nr:succinylglutamate desuccinylase/aspartoacylase family protein [Campylobacterales bacterium]
MKKIEIIRLESLSRAPLVVEGFSFKGSDPGAPSAAIVGAMEGGVVLPLYIASALVDFLKNSLPKKRILGNILIVPSINHYALNIRERFWPLDKTNLNMMFPGYDQGETTQRIAKKLFDALQGHTYGISLETRPDPASCLPYVSLFQSGYEDLEGAKRFGLEFIYHKGLTSIDTVSLQYNWQLWETKAYTLMCPSDTQVKPETANTLFQAVLRFLSQSGVIDYHMFNAAQTDVITRSDIEVIKASRSGIFVPKRSVGSYVATGEIIGTVIHALDGATIHRFEAPCDGVITCINNQALIYEKAVAFRIARSGTLL